ncbi:hypothetical protein SAMN05444169_6406 [Bradyrhizobium erythrophlei]|uniref:Uncharacterized protein n=1 Tax=Bradyrhizobium erythrophlei TaxID=1437360 RepID=A0A1M5R8W6_9BRAD|nr:hypothetical protein SAMN05444169_6406 [Bradyrhizobium erythrophlei]
MRSFTALFFRFLRQHHHDGNFAFKNARSDSGDMEGKRVLDLCRSIFVSGVNIENSTIKFVELDAPEKTIKIIRPNN